MHFRLIASNVTTLGKASLLKLLRSSEENSTVCKCSKTCLPTHAKETQILRSDYVNRSKLGSCTLVLNSSPEKGEKNNLVTLVGEKLTFNLRTIYVTYFVRFEILKTWTFYLKAYDAVQLGRCLLSFRTDLLPPSSEKDSILKMNVRPVATPQFVWNVRFIRIQYQVFWRRTQHVLPKRRYTSNKLSASRPRTQWESTLL